MYPLKEIIIDFHCRRYITENWLLFSRADVEHLSKIDLTKRYFLCSTSIKNTCFLHNRTSYLTDSWCLSRSNSTLFQQCEIYVGKAILRRFLWQILPHNGINTFAATYSQMLIRDNLIYGLLLWQMVLFTSNQFLTKSKRWNEHVILGFLISLNTLPKSDKQPYLINSIVNCLKHINK